MTRMMFSIFVLKCTTGRELVKVLPKTGGGFVGGGSGLGLRLRWRRKKGAVFSRFQQLIHQGQSAQGGGGINNPAKLTDSELLDEKLEQIVKLMRADAAKRTIPPTAENTLLDLVQEMIQPDSWQDTGQGLGTVDCVNGILVVSQTEEILQEIDNFVADLEGNILRKGKGRKIELGATTLREIDNATPRKPKTASSKKVEDNPFAASEQGDSNDEDDPFK